MSCCYSSGSIWAFSFPVLFLLFSVRVQLSTPYHSRPLRKRTVMSYEECGCARTSLLDPGGHRFRHLQAGKCLGLQQLLWCYLERQKERSCLALFCQSKFIHRDGNLTVTFRNPYQSLILHFLI